jgi:hypothetical protein
MFLLSLTTLAPVYTVTLKAGLSIYKRHAADRFQCPLRARFPPRLIPGVQRQKFAAMAF